MRHPASHRITPYVVFGIVALALHIGGAAAQGAADNYPSRPVTIIIPFATGGSTEFEFRPYAQKLIENTGKQFILDYKAGAGSMVGTAFVAKAVPDGYTVLGSTSSYAALPSLYPELPYDPIKDLASVSLMTKKSSLLVVHPSLPVKNVKEFIAYARSAPGKVNHATSGAGGSPHLRAAYFYNLIGATPTFVHYKGTGQMTLDMVAGRVDAAITLPTLIVSQMKAGKLRVLATTGRERLRLLPEVPTVIESGVPGFEFSGWGAMWAPAGTPAAIVNKLSLEMAKVARAPEIVQRFGEEGWQMIGSTPDELRQWVIEEINITRRLVKETGITMEQ